LELCGVDGRGSEAQGAAQYDQLSVPKLFVCNTGITYVAVEMSVVGAEEKVGELQLEILGGWWVLT
jgi:hypothetical protein